MAAEQVAPVERGDGEPQRAGLVLVTLILGAAVANLNLAVANVALPSIGKAFDSSRTSLNKVAVGYSLGLVAVLRGGASVATMFPRKEREQQLLAEYQAQDEEMPEPG